ILLPMIVGWLPSKITVGADGVLTEWLGRRRFVPYSQIDQVMVLGHGARLVLHGGGHVDLATSPYRQRTNKELELKRDAIVARIAAPQNRARSRGKRSGRRAPRRHRRRVHARRRRHGSAATACVIA